MVKPRSGTGQPFSVTNDRDDFFLGDFRNVTDVRLSQGYGDDSKLELAYACRGSISNGNFHCLQRCMLKNRVLTEMNECHKMKLQTSFSL